MLKCTKSSENRFVLLCKGDFITEEIFSILSWIFRTEWGKNVNKQVKEWRIKFAHTEYASACKGLMEVCIDLK